MNKLLHQFYHNFFKRDELYFLIKFYKESQYWPIDKLKHFQAKKTEELILYSVKNVPYYSELFNKKALSLKNVTDPSNYSKIPLLTKEIIRDHLKELIAVNVDKKYILPNSTSGSSGSNLKFYSDKSNLTGQALDFRNYEWMGLNYFDKKVTIWGASWDVKRSRKILPAIKKKFKKNIILSGYQLSEQMMGEYFKVIEKHKPALLHSYPSILYTIAEFFEKNNLIYFPKAIISAGEKLHPFQREKIEQVFKTKIFDFYGARDIPLIAQECEAHQGLHVMMENVLLEVVDDAGNPIEEGEGDLVLTHLHNKVMPFIRYKIGDRAKISKRTCMCGRNLPLIEEVIGRTFEIIEFPNGNKVGGSFWTLVMRSVPGVKDFQVVQKSIDKITINYISEGGDIKENLNNLQRRISEYSGPQLKIEFNELDEIPLTKGGKFQFVISNIKK